MLIFATLVASEIDAFSVPDILLNMTWGNSNGGGGWESTTDSAWPTTQVAPLEAAAAEQPMTTNTVSSIDPDAQQADNVTTTAIENEDSEATTKGANPEWTGHGQSRYDYEGFVDRDGEYEGNARVYYWDGDEGDVGPEFPELELEIFGPPDQRGEIYGPEIAK